MQDLKPPLIAVVDDDDSFREALADLLSYARFQTEGFCSAEEALESGSLDAYDAFLLDVQMPGVDGLELLERLRAIGIKAPAIFLTSHTDPATRQRAFGCGALALFSKPFDTEELIGLMHRTLPAA